MIKKDDQYSMFFKTAVGTQSGNPAKNFTIFVIGLMFLSAVFAQTVRADCEHWAWVTDKDVNGLNVRDKPGTDGKIIGNLKFAGDDDDELIIVTVTGYSNGWVKINDATTISGNQEFSGIGWVSAKMVTVSTQATGGAANRPVTIYSRPNSRSKKVGKIPNEEYVEIVGFDCFGYKVKYLDKIGWLSTNDMCGNPVTTCP